ncbi:hypothetical protein TNCV_2859571 [Trichonephila clavipes]|nr:hypothetical protein TNCV_2859571 [Trichonephila clavipes]
MPRRDGPYVILTQISPSYEIASLDNPGEPLGVYHTSALTPCNNDKVKPLIPLRKRGRLPKVPQTPGSSSGPEGEDVTNVHVGANDICLTVSDLSPRNSSGQRARLRLSLAVALSTMQVTVQFGSLPVQF